MTNKWAKKVCANTDQAWRRELADAFDAMLAEKDKQLAEKDAEIARLKKNAKEAK